MDHVAPRKSCANSIIDIKSESEDALGIADVSTMTNTAKPCIRAWCEVLNILRFSLWNLPRNDKGVAGTGSNGDYRILNGINPLLHTQVLIKPLQEVRATSEITGADSSAKCEALLVHAVSKSPQGSRTQLRKVAPHHTSEKEVNEGNVTLSPVPPDTLELCAVVVAEQTGKHLGCATKMPLVPLAVCHQQLSESCWIFCPEVLSHSVSRPLTLASHVSWRVWVPP